MSSTRDTERVRRFFVERIVPGAARVRARGVSFLPLGPTQDESAYERPPAGPEFRTLESHELEAALREQWRDLPELAELVPRLLELARSLEVQAEDDGEISPFVYVMY